MALRSVHCSFRAWFLLGTTSRSDKDKEDIPEDMPELSESVKAYLDALFKSQTETLTKENVRLRATIETRNKHLNDLQAETSELKTQIQKLQASIDKMRG